MLVSDAATWWTSGLDITLMLAGKGLYLLPDSDLSSDGEAEAVFAQLVRRCGTGDRAAFQVLYKAHSARLYGLALRITRQPALASDAVHDALLQAWQRAGSFDPSRGTVSAWLTGLVRYRAIDVMRKRAREVTGVELPETADDTPGALERLLASAAGAALHRCLSLLDAQPRQAIMLAFVDGLSHAELAVRLNTPLGTVKSWIRRGLQSLKGCLEP
jgi:RNA polymerase sigma-70 factor (ECF subfamily)